MSNVPDEVRDPIVTLIAEARRQAQMHQLVDLEAAVYAAAFSLYGPYGWENLAQEAAYFCADQSWDLLAGLFEASKRRKELGILGTTDTTVRYEP